MTAGTGTSDGPIRVAVLGHGPTALGTLRCLAQAGMEAHLVSRAGDPATLSRWARGRTLIAPDASVEVLHQLASRFDSSRTVLLPCTDEWAKVVVHSLSHLPFLASLPPPAVIESFVDKLSFAEILTGLGIPKPETVPVHSAEDLDRPLDRMFLKPRQSQLFGQVFHRKAITFADRREALEGLEAMKSIGVDAVLQEMIPGPPSSHYFIDGFMTRDRRVAALFARRRERMYPLDFGNSTAMTSIPLNDVGTAADDLVRLVESVDYRGIFSAEFKFDPRDGKLKLLEVNSRPWWFIEFASVCGVNVCAMAVEDALGREVRSITGYDVGRRCVYLRPDVRAYRAMPHNRRPTIREVTRSWIGATPTVFSWSDPLPAAALATRLLPRNRRARTA